MTAHNPFTSPATKTHTDGAFFREEVALANRNSGLLLEGLQYDVTPAGMHYLLIHFDVPYVTPAAAADWHIDIDGLVAAPRRVSLAAIEAMPRRTSRVTLECAGGGRALMSPRWPSMPWMGEAVSTAEWTGTPLRHVLDAAGVAAHAREIVFTGADRGFDRNEHTYQRSLSVEAARSDDVLLVYAMNGQPLLPQHGYPLRLVVPGWYGMASVKWLTGITAIDHAFKGHQQIGTYVYRREAGDPGVPVTHIRVRALMLPPGIPDWYTRRRLLDRGPTELMGRAWVGGGAAIARVEVAVDGMWRDARLDPPASRYAWRRWTCGWDAVPGDHTLMCRATDAAGNVQPLEPPFDRGGFGNNVVQRVEVTVR